MDEEQNKDANEQELPEQNKYRISLDFNIWADDKSQAVEYANKVIGSGMYGQYVEVEQVSTGDEKKDKLLDWLKNPSGKREEIDEMLDDMNPNDVRSGGFKDVNEE